MPVASPSSFSYPNYRQMNCTSMFRRTRCSSFSRSTSSSPGRALAREVRECPWCYSCRQAEQANWLRPRTHSNYWQSVVTTSPRCDSLLVQQNIYYVTWWAIIGKEGEGY